MSDKVTAEQAIAEYQPAWMPPDGALTGIVIVVDPVGGGARDSKRRVADDLNLLTAGHLYHLLRRADATPVMTRADDRPMPGSEQGVGKALQAVAHQKKAHLVVVIDSAAGSGNAAAPLASEALSNELAETLARRAACQSEGSPGEAGRQRALTGADPPGAIVRLTIPPAGLPRLTRQAYHRGCAEAIYKAIADFVAAHREALDAERVKRFPGTNSPAAGPVPLYPDRTPPETVVQAARRVWPHGDLPIDKTRWFCSMYRRTALSDGTCIYFEPHTRVEGDAVIVGGATEIAYLRDTMAEALRVVGIKNVTNEMRVLPEEGRLGARRFGACVAPMALTFADPSEYAGLQSQLLYGEPVLLLDRSDGYYLLHGRDGYWGWVRQECIRVMTADEYSRYTSAVPAVLLRDVELADRRIERGSTLPVAAGKDGRVILMMPDGGTFDVAAGDVRIADEAAVARQRVGQALDLLYRPYVFGAVAPIGMDCSGLVRNVCVQTGVPVARDAAQQFLHGELVATRWHRDDIRPGDFLFFIDLSGKIYHVGIAISPTHFVHSSPPEVKVTSLVKGDRLYIERREATFFAAKRW